MEPQVLGRTQRLSQPPPPGDSLNSAEIDKGLGNMHTGTHKLDLFPLGFFFFFNNFIEAELSYHKIHLF